MRVQRNVGKKGKTLGGRTGVFVVVLVLDLAQSAGQVWLAARSAGTQQIRVAD